MTTLTRALVDSVGDAFNANDIDAVMKHFADDATFDHAVGPEEHGVRFEGAETIRGVFAGLFSKVENVHWETLYCAISGNKAYCEYRRTAKHKDGKVEQFLSVDILTYQDGLIVHKDTYYKQRTG
ncbi:nuclear transport factor 2 family protein [Marivita sp.]|jgi:ketosteroid isomerase-like protein|uniref:nuclear transport factor 2 family protein n=1 Tax=Marivita sp. TaxID=2003365 RepID=UPI00321A0F45